MALSVPHLSLQTNISIFSIDDDDDISSLISLEISPDGNTIAFFSCYGMIILLDIKTNAIIQLVSTSILNYDISCSVKWSPNGSLLTSSNSIGEIFIWDTLKGTHLRTLTGHTNNIMSISWCQDSLILASIYYDKTMKLWNTLTGEILSSFEHSNIVRIVSFSLHGSFIATIDTEKLYIFDARNISQPLSLIDCKHSNVSDISWSPTNKIIVTVCAKQIKIWDTFNGSSIHILEINIDYMTFLNNVAFTPDGRRLTCSTTDGSIMIWETSNWKCKKIIKYNYKSITNILWTDYGLSLITCNNNMLRIYDFTTPEMKTSLVLQMTAQRLKKRRFIPQELFDKIIYEFLFWLF